LRKRREGKGGRKNREEIEGKKCGPKTGEIKESSKMGEKT
jgi:hypothetical protein